jgi:hypothetical protein
VLENAEKISKITGWSSRMMMMMMIQSAQEFGERSADTGKHTSHLGRRRFRNNEEVQRYIREWLRKQEAHNASNEICINFCQVETNASACLGD